MSRQPGHAHKSARPPKASPTPSFSAFVADAQYFGDLCIALAGPLVMLSAIVRSVDPRVGGPHGGAGAAILSPPADPTANGATRQALLPQAALEDFPFGSSVIKQVLHVAGHLPWYTVVAPSRLGDWATVLLNIVRLNFTCTLLLLAACPRGGAVWAWWRRNRSLVVFTTNLMARCLPVLSTLLLLPPCAWPTHQLARFLVSASTSPLVYTLALCVFDLMAKVPLAAVVIQTLAQTAAIFIQAYRVAPTIVTRWREQQQPGAGQQDGPVPLQCGSPLRPEHSALLSCRPLAVQVLLGLAMVTWPVGLAWAVEMRLRRQHAELCRERERRRGLRRGQQGGTPHAPASAQQQRLPACHEAGLLGSGRRGVHTASVSGSASKAPDGSPCQQTPADAHAVGPRPGTARGGSGDPHSRACEALDCPLPRGTPAEVHAVGPCLGAPPAAPSAPRPSARYRSRMTSATVTVKVLEHPGNFEEYGSRLASVLQDCVREELGHSAAASAVPDRQPAAVEPVLWTTVIRGCVQVVLWGWVAEAVLGGGGAGGVGDGAGEEDLLQRLVPRLRQRMAQQEGAGSVRGVSVQVGQQVAVLGDSVQGVQLPGGGGGGSSASIRLLQMSPPAASLAAVAEPAPLDVRLLLHSPVPQMARVLVLAERAGDANGSSAAEPHKWSCGCGLAPRLPTRARLLLELPVQLVGGVQEVEVALGAGELAGALAEECKSGEPGAEEAAGAVGVLRVVMVGPEHQPVSVAGQREEVAEPRLLVHWVAPPLLLLPPAVAAEVCGAWEAMQREAAGWSVETEQAMQRGARSGLAETEQHGKRQEQGQGQGQGQGQEPARQQPRGEEKQAEAGGSAPHTVGQPLAIAERESFLWWSHMAPLLGDLAHALGGQQGMEQEVDGETAGPVWQALLPYLQGRGMAETLSLLGTLVQGHTSQQGHRVGVSHGRATPADATANTLLGSLPRPFSPPSLELRYQQWRLERLALTSPYALLIFDTGVGLTLLLRALAPLPVPPVPVSEGGARASSLLLRRMARAAALVLLTMVSDLLGRAVLYVKIVLRQGRTTTQRQQPQQAWPAVRVSPRDVVWYRLAACVAGPAVALLCGALALLGVTPVDPRAIGKIRPVYGSGLVRAIVVPCLQQMSTVEAVAAAPLLGLGEVLMLMHMQRAWGVWRAGAVAAMWRLVAVGVSAAWERRSRARFVQGQQQQAAGARVGDLQASGAGEGPVVSKTHM